MSPIKQYALRCLKVMQLTLSVFCFVGLGVTTLLITAQVFNRYWLHFEIMWFSDLALYCYLMFMFVAATLATWREGHVAVDFFRDSVLKGNERACAIYRVCIVIISIVVASTFLPVTYQIIGKALKYPEYCTLVPWFNTSWIRIVLTVSYSLVVLYLLIIARKAISDLLTIYRSGSRR